MKALINTGWVIVTVKSPVMFHQTADECWLLNPNRRYIMNANRVNAIEDYVDTVSEFKVATLQRTLDANRNLNGCKILVERCRERGIGDLLFLTGPLGYLNHITGGNIEIDVMGFSDRSAVLSNSPLIHNKCVKHGPVEYDALRYYNYHWFVDTVTEQDAEPDQLNVYDALFRQINLDHEQIDSKWKRPSVTLVQEDYLGLDALYRTIWEARKMDLRRIGYYVVAPFSNSNLRCLPYSSWLKIIGNMATRKPVVIVGNSNLRLPETDMDAGTFLSHASKMGQAVVNCVDGTNLRTLMALMARASAVVTLDSAPLYIAQAVNTPAVSIWGTHAPGSRIGYDRAYMDLAIWNSDACTRCPCFAFSEFPASKCPDGEKQRTCEVLLAVTPEQILNKIDAIEDMNAIKSLKA